MKTTIKKPMKKAQKIESVVISMLVDESGSMTHLAAATMAGFNEYVDTIKKEFAEARAYFSAIKFDTRGVRKLQVGAKIADAVHLNTENYQPSGGTPLLDAIGKTVMATDEVMMKECGTKAIVVIQTDGEENASREFDLPKIKVMIEERQSKGWQFVFIGAGINAFLDATKMGIAAANTMSYTPDAASTRSTFAATASNSRLFASGMASNMNYSAEQSLMSGERADITRAKMASSNQKKIVAGMNEAISSLSLTS